MSKDLVLADYQVDDEGQNTFYAESSLSKSDQTDLCFSFQDDVDNDLKYLDGMGGDLGGLVDRLLPGTSKRFAKMLDTRNNRKLMCYTILFSVVAFFILYHLLSYRG